MVYLLSLVYLLLIFKAILRCLHFWQQKEYRFDRFKEFLSTPDANRYFLPTRWFLRPRFTFKILILVYLAFYLSLLIVKPISSRVLTFGLIYLSLPITTALAVMLFSPITSLFYDFIYLLAKIKLKFYKKNLIVIGITGSYAKTTTKEILAHLLSEKYQVLKTPGTQNTAIGAALTILKNLNSKHNIFVVEMGAYKKGEIKKICQLVNPKIGILTGITKQHLGLFGSFDNLLQAKYELITALPQDGLAVFNQQNQFCRQLANQTKHVPVKFFKSPSKKLNTNLIGHHHQLNLASAILVANYLGVKSKYISSSLKTIPSFKTLMTIIQAKSKAVILIDTYNSNPVGFAIAINEAKKIKAKNKILVTPGILETGKAKKEIHLHLAKKSAKVFNQIIITKKDIFEIFQTTSQKKSKTQIIFQPNLKKLIKHLKLKLNKNSLVLLEGRLHQKLANSL